MNKLIIATAAALVLGSPLAFAASTTNNTLVPKQPVAASTLSERCTALGQQFDKVEAQHMSNKNYKQAMALRSEGKSLCTAHKSTEGIKKIESALTMIGVKPASKS
jgi:hypothetical protein